MKATQVALVVAFVAATGVLSAQTTTAPAPAATVPAATIHERETHQQDRIAEGLKSGEMTAAEASTVETQEAGIKKEQAGMRAQDNGKLTTADKTLLNSQLNTESKEIYADKHNGATQPAAKGEINDRLQNQQDRIANDLKSSKLTDTQAAHLETQEAGLVKEESGMKAQDNGKLSAADKKLLNHQLNQESRRIQREQRRTVHHK